jgi:hypothetical protein
MGEELLVFQGAGWQPGFGELLVQLVVDALPRRDVEVVALEHRGTNL